MDEYRRQIEALWDEHGIPDVYDGPSALEIHAYVVALSQHGIAVDTMWCSFNMEAALT